MKTRLKWKRLYLAMMDDRYQCQLCGRAFAWEDLNEHAKHHGRVTCSIKKRKLRNRSHAHWVFSEEGA